MNCPDIVRSLPDYVVDDNSQSAKEKSIVTEHLELCSSCRVVAEQMKSTIEIIQPPEYVVTEHVLDEILANVKSIIDQRQRRRLSCKLCYVISALSAAAAVVLFAAAIYLYLGLEPSRKSALVAQSPVGVTTPESERPKSQRRVLFDSWAEYVKLKQAFAKAEESANTESFDAIIKAAKGLVQLNPNSKLTGYAQELISRCYTQMADSPKAIKMFLAYVESVRKQSGDEQAAQILCAEGRLLFEKKDYLKALSYFDALRARFPNSDASNYAQYMTGRYYLAVQQPTLATQEFEGLVSDKTNVKYSKMARKALILVYYNSGQYAKVFDSYEDFIKIYPRKKDVVEAYFHMGILAMGIGKTYWPRAIEYFTRIEKRFPDEPCAIRAREMLSKLSDEAFEDITKDMFKM